MGSEYLQKLKQILNGIDKCETDDPNGWWETSAGAEFGAEKLREIDELMLVEQAKKASCGDGGTKPINQLVNELADKICMDAVALVGKIAEARAMHQLGKVKDALDIIFREINDRFVTDRFASVDMTLRFINVGRTPDDLLVGILTATLPAKDKLYERPNFYKRVAKDERMTIGDLAGLE